MVHLDRPACMCLTEARSGLFILVITGDRGTAFVQLLYRAPMYGSALKFLQKQFCCHAARSNTKGETPTAVGETLTAVQLGRVGYAKRILDSARRHSYNRVNTTLP